MENKPITLEDLRKDILRLQTLVIALQDLAVSQGKRISELEEDARPMPPEVKEKLKQLHIKIGGVV